MQKEETIAYVINELGKHHSRNEIVRKLCEQSGMMWADAEKLVKQIEVDHSHDIKARQSPLVIALGIVLFIGGIGLILYCAVYFIGLTQRDAVGVVRSGRGVISAIGALFVGISMIAGAAVGLRKTIQELFEDKENR